MPRPATPARIHRARLVLGFKVFLLFDAGQRPRAPHAQQHDLEDQAQRRGPIAHADVPRVAHGVSFPRGVGAASARAHCVRDSRSRMIERTRASAAPIAYIHAARLMSSIACSMATFIDVPLKLTLDPWWSVFH